MAETGEGVLDKDTETRDRMGSSRKRFYQETEDFECDQPMRGYADVIVGTHGGLSKELLTVSGL